MKALVVEDDLKSQCLLAKVLAERGLEVNTFENAEQAILEYQKEFYPLLFVDVGLPGMDGLQFCRWIRSQPMGEGTYIITAVEPSQDMAQVLEAGANDFLTKPYQLEALRARLTIGERQMTLFFEQQQLAESLRQETQRWSSTEAALLRARQENEAALRARESEVAQLREQLRVQAASQELEASLEHAVEQQNADLEKLRQEIGGLWERCVDLERTAEEARRDADSTRSRALEAEQALDAARGELSKLRASEGDSLDSARAELQRRDEELKRVRSELTDLREELAARLREHTGELVNLSEQLRQSLEDRKKVETELAAARDELVRRGREQVDESLQRADELRELVEERRRLEVELEARNREQEAEQQRLRAELDKVERERDSRAAESTQMRVALASAQERAAAAEAERNKISEELRVHRDARKQYAQRWQAVLRLATEFNQVHSAEEAAQVASRAAQGLVGWDRFSFDVYDAEGDWILPVLNLECTQGVVGKTKPLHSGPQPTSLMRRVLEDGAQLMVRLDPSPSNGEVELVGRRTRRSSALLCVPVNIDGRTLGFISLRGGSAHAYEVEDLERMELVAAHCAAALERVELRLEREEHRSSASGLAAGLAVSAGS